jgi:hypothetical protein
MGLGALEFAHGGGGDANEVLSMREHSANPASRAKRFECGFCAP